ncbi:VOC family protein [Parasedimentitalea maritima]|uniref:VOC family protein n=1 Tax=Parasedimentitalea maritima TaxID=2578117 RepID=A0A6A4RG69_9RHOB|nr:VOC family protein [Zongyanglinia marina]KAE9630377.1 VOC family protein [Zongyanglinia marina]
MIGYISVGTNDLARSSAYYDTILGMLGASRIMEMDDFIVWGTKNGTTNFSVHVPENKAAATVGNGMMIALHAENPETVTAVHAKAIELGSEDCGAPGPRHGDSGFFAAYFRDPDGNKLNLHCMTGTT